MKQTFSTTNKKKTITIIGAGLTGCFMAILLAKRGYSVKIYEKSTHKEISSHASKRSFNVTFYGYAVDALKKAGLWEKILPQLIVLNGSVTQVGKFGKKTYVSFREDSMVYYTIQRAQLLKVLIQEASKNSLIKFYFNTPIIAINRRKKEILLKTASKNSATSYEMLLGTDGANSLVRPFLQQGQKTKHKQTYATWEYKQVVLPERYVTQLALQKDTQYVWTRKHATVIAFPGPNGTYAALFMLPKGNKNGFFQLENPTKIKQFIARHFPDLATASSVFEHELLENPKGNFTTITTTPWFYKDSIVILGDAAHAFLPFYGIGMSIGFGDCLLIDSLLQKHNEDWVKILPLYQKQRKCSTDVIGELCLESLTRFRRHKLADYPAIYDKVESILHRIFPKFVLPPLFNLVVSNPDHADIMYKNHQRQRKVMTMFGLSFMISSLTLAVASYEKLLYYFLAQE